MKQRSTVTTVWHTPCWGDPPIFRSDHDAIQWAIGQGAFTNEADAAAAYAALRERHPVATRAHWLGHVAGMLTQQRKEASTAQNAPGRAKNVSRSNRSLKQK